MNHKQLDDLKELLVNRMFPIYEKQMKNLSREELETHLKEVYLRGMNDLLLQLSIAGALKIG